MDLMDKLRILTDSAKYDAACTSSGSDRGGQAGMLGARWGSAFVTALRRTGGASPCSRC